MNYPLQYIVFPDSVNTTESLFVREKDITLDKKGNAESYHCLSFDTYFNTFSLKKWLTYTSIDDLKLVIRASGDYWVEIYELNRDNTEKKIKTIEYSSKELAENVIDIPLNRAQMVFFRLYHQGNLTVDKIYYATQAKPVNDIYLSAVICTFKKEDYVYKNIGLFKEIYKKHPELLEKLEINIVDNGQSLDEEKIDSPNTTVYPNINVGGAGGFARGMIEVLRKPRKSSHILVMDDDIEIMPESIFLTISFLTYIRQEFSRHFVGGMMLNIMYKNIKSASLEWVDTATAGIGSIGEQDLFNRHEMLICDVHSKHPQQHQAWWYCVIPTAVVNLNNLPFPLFFRWDDIDFSLRNRAQVILVNGICVWHEPFYRKHQVFPDYLQLRNMLALSAIREEIDEDAVLKLIQKRFNYHLMTFNYQSAEAYIDIFENILQGPEFYMDSGNCTVALKIGLSRNEKLMPISEMKGMDEFFDYHAACHSNGRLKGLKKFLMEKSLNGQLFSIGKHQKGRSIAHFADNQPENFYKRDEVLVIDPWNGTAGIRKRSGAEFSRLYKKMKDILKRYARERRLIREKFKELYPTMISYDFWKKYLGLN